MTLSNPPDLEGFWSEVLSGDPERIRAAATALAPDERASLVAHLDKMASGEGWNEGQRLRAHVALEALQSGGRGTRNSEQWSVDSEQ